MADRKKKTPSDKTDKKGDEKNWWKAPAIITGILALIGTIITTLPALLTTVNDIRSSSMEEPTPTVVDESGYQPGFCDGYFSSDAVVIQSGIPKRIGTERKKVIEVKLMDNSTLVGGIKFLTETRHMYTSDHLCAEVKPPFSIEFDTLNTVEFGEFILQATFIEATHSLELELTKK